jgi:U3 small nucleolar RNA-associated protein 10
MVSGAYLDELLVCSNISAEAGLDDEANENRRQCLRLLAKLVDAKVMFAALEQNWAKAADSGFSVSEPDIDRVAGTCALTDQQALTEYLQILGLSLDKHPKSAIARNIPALSAIFLNALDLRRQDRYKEATGGQAVANLRAIEDSVNEVALKMIYKLNDAVFRPIFAQLIEYSDTGLPKQDTVGRILRHESVYGFLYTFFDNLKSIVTSYATYVIDSATTILKESNPRNPEEKELWKRVLRTLGKCFEHDQDDFWQAPSHFGAVAPVLIEQFGHAAIVDVTEELVPTIVELVAAADSQEHQKELNGSLLRLLRSEQAAVRLAVVLCQQALTDRLGEDWLSMLPEMLPYISELQDDDDEVVERETHRWIVKIEGILGESLDSMLQ